MNIKDQLNQLIADIQGQFIEITDKTNIYQCFDLAELWVLCLGIPLSTIKHLYAYQIYTNPNPNTTQYFDLIPNTPTFIPEDGDIAVFDKSAGNIAGHVGVALGGGTVNSFMLFNQNNPLGTNSHLASYNYNIPKMLGVLRPKITTTELVITDQTRIPQIDNLQVDQIRSERNDLKRDLSNAQDKITRAKNDLA